MASQPCHVVNQDYGLLARPSQRAVSRYPNALILNKQFYHMLDCCSVIETPAYAVVKRPDLPEKSLRPLVRKPVPFNAWGDAASA